MSNIDCGVDTIITKRKYPNKIAKYAKIAHQPFKKEAKKDLPYLALTYLYNTEIN